MHLEYLRRKPVIAAPITPASSDQEEPEFICLEMCMDRLTANNRELVLQYYQQEKKAKIEHRKLLAEKLGIAVNALRIRAFRIRVSLQKCVQECLERTAT